MRIASFLVGHKQTYGALAGNGVIDLGARRPPLWMRPGDVVEVEVAEIGVLRNHVIAEA